MERIGMGGILLSVFSALFVLLGILLVWIQTNSDLIQGYGSYGRLSFVESFPYMPLGIILCGLVFLTLLLRKFDISYKRSLGFVLILIIGIGISIAWYFSTIPLGNKLFTGGGRMMRMHGNSGANFVFGTVNAIAIDSITVADASGKTYTIKTTDSTHYPYGAPSVGDTVRSVGTWDGSTFIATGVRAFDEESQEGMRGRGMGQGRGRGMMMPK